MSLDLILAPGSGPDKTARVCSVDASPGLNRSTAPPSQLNSNHRPEVVALHHPARHRSLSRDRRVRALCLRDHGANERGGHVVDLRFAASGPAEAPDSDREPPPDAPAGYLRWFIDTEAPADGTGPSVWSTSANRSVGTGRPVMRRTSTCFITSTCGSTSTVRCDGWRLP